MKRGTTPTHIFTITDEDVKILSKISVAYSQNDEIVLEKDIEDIKTEMSYKLTQGETLKFDRNKPVEIEVTGVTLGGDVIKSGIFVERCEKCLSERLFV